MDYKPERSISPQPLRTASDLLGIQEGQLLYWARKGVLPTDAIVKTNNSGKGHRRYRVSVIRNWMEQENIHF